MFEPQDHPNVIPYPGAPPTRPYDNAGWTLAYQMGVRFDRMLEPFTGPFEKITDWNVKPPAGRIASPNGAAAMTFDPAVNDSWVAVNRLLAAGESVSAVPAQNGVQLVVDVKAGTTARLQSIAKEIGLNFTGLAAKPAAGHALRAPRIGLWDQYGGSMESGWTRWILEQFEFKFDRVFGPQLDAGGLNAKYDVLVFPNGGIPSGQGGGRGGRGGAPPREADVPAEYRAQLGRVSAERTIPQLRQFVEAGGTIVAIGDAAANLAEHFKLPIENHLADGGNALPPSKFFVPGSVLTAKVDTTNPAAAGMPARADFFFDNSPVFKLTDGAAAAGVFPIAMFDTATPVRSGWGWGQQYLKDGVIAVDAKVGKGRVLLFGPEILQRAQPHGTFKLLFNSLYLSIVNQ
jgi:hypothetical protein